MIATTAGDGSDLDPSGPSLARCAAECCHITPVYGRFK
jgi:hypothetical protein